MCIGCLAYNGVCVCVCVCVTALGENRSYNYELVSVYEASEREQWKQGMLYIYVCMDGMQSLNLNVHVGAYFTK